MWELFLKGLAKTFEEFALKMIEKGQKDIAGAQSQQKARWVHTEASAQAAEDKTSQQPVPSFVDSKEVKGKIMQIMINNPDGLTMKAIAKELDLQWHFVRVPIRELLADGKMVKNDLLYMLPEASKKAAGAESGRHTSEKGRSRNRQEETVVLDDTAAFMRSLKADLVYPIVPEEKTEIEKEAPVSTEISESPSEAKPSAQTSGRTEGSPRRRVVDATRLEQKPKSETPLSTMSTRDRERMRYRIMTALRGRPEGLTLEKLAVVVGMESSLIQPIINELHSEIKIITVEGDKYKLP
ncbi:hypothetical protein JW823_05370 [bacterium]|nr:hypothetical protein [candidate division CSSED10-310 bacterium]